MQRRDMWRSKITTRLILAEAAICVVSARIVLALLPFPRLMRLLTRPTRRAEVEGTARLHHRQAVRKAIFAVRHALQGQTTCLHRAIAAYVMLRRRGVSTTLFFGATRLPVQGLTTHAWVQDGTAGVVGYHTAQQNRYYVVATFPEVEKSPEVEQSKAFNQQLGDEHEHEEFTEQRSKREAVRSPETRLDHTRV